MTKDATYQLLGVPVTVTNKLTEGTAILADASNIAVAQDSSAVRALRVGSHIRAE